MAAAAIVMPESESARRARAAVGVSPGPVCHRRFLEYHDKGPSDSETRAIQVTPAPARAFQVRRQNVKPGPGAAGTGRAAGY